MVEAVAEENERPLLDKAVLAGRAPEAMRISSEVGRADRPSVLDDGDTSAWAVPYTDLTMLLMVFFVVMLSQAGPSGSVSNDGHGHEAFATVMAGSLAAMRPDGSGRASAAEVLPGGADGLLPGYRGLDESEDGDEEPELADMARRIQLLETSTATFLAQSGLQAHVGLSATSSGIEMRMPDDVLFASGSATLEPEGVGLIAGLAPLLREIDAEIQVSGHTDNVPIRTHRFPSNWELSAARAIAVVRLLRDMNVPGGKMQAVGHGENRPIASNSAPEGRARNRRVTIEVAPNIGFQDRASP